MSDKPEKESPEKKRKILGAWQEWKERCAVNACSAENKSLLQGEIKSGFQRKLNRFAGAFMSRDERFDFGDVDYATEFDSALYEYEHREEEGHKIYDKGFFGDPNHVRKAKAWKDFTWDTASKSSDPPLQVIRGKLVGSVGIINDIVENFLAQNYPGRFHNDMYVVNHSLDVPAVENSGVSVESLLGNDDRIIFPGSDVEVEEAVWQKWMSEFYKTVTTRDCAFLLAQAYGITLYDDAAILKDLGVAKSAAYNGKDRVLKKVKKDAIPPEMAKEIQDSAQCRKRFLDSLEDKIRVEKLSPTLLLRIAECKEDR